MKTHKILAVLVTAIFLMVPATTAQQQAQGSASFTIDGIKGGGTPITPDTGSAEITVDWTYTIDSRGYELSGAQNPNALLKWTQPSCANNFVKVSGALSKSFAIVDGSNVKTNHPDKSTFTIRATTEAPGEQLIDCTFKGKVQAVGSFLPATQEDSVVTQITVDYYGLIQATSASRLKEASPQKTITYDIEVRNFGNARTQVGFELLQQPKGNWNPILPEPILLDSPASGQGVSVQTTKFQIATPFKNGWNNEEGTFSLLLKPVSAKNPDKKGADVQVNVLGRVRGVYVPTLEPLVMVGAVLGSAMLLRMRREDE